MADQMGTNKDAERPAPLKRSEGPDTSYPCDSADKYGVTAEVNAYTGAGTYQTPAGKPV